MADIIPNKRKHKIFRWLSNIIKAVVITVSMLLILHFASEVNENAAYLDKDKHVLILAEILAALVLWKITETNWPWWGRMGGMLAVIVLLLKIIEVFPEYRNVKDNEMCHEGLVCRKGIVLEDNFGKKYAVDEQICREYNGRWLTEYQACDFNPPQP